MKLYSWQDTLMLVVMVASLIIAVTYLANGRDQLQVLAGRERAVGMFMLLPIGMGATMKGAVLSFTPGMEKWGYILVALALCLFGTLGYKILTR